MAIRLSKTCARLPNPLRLLAILKMKSGQSRQSSIEESSLQSSQEMCQTLQDTVKIAMLNQTTIRKVRILVLKEI